MKHSIVFFLMIFAFLGIEKNLATAQAKNATYQNIKGHSGYCDQAESTASTQRCLKRHLDSAQRRLNVIYQKLGTTLEGEKLEELKDLQQTWLRYRDTECMWESTQTQTPSLKRVHELSCMARVTEDRADLLDIVLGDIENPEGQREYGAFPRWMNALAKDHPQTYWDYGQRKSYDLNCDGENEFIMEGIQVKKLKAPNKLDKEKEEEKEILPVSFSSEKIIAIVQNPPLGRPKTKTFSFPIMEEETTKGLCQDQLSLIFKETKKEAEKEADLDEKKKDQAECHATLTIKDKNCAHKTIIWTGKEFALHIEKEADESAQK